MIAHRDEGAGECFSCASQIYWVLESRAPVPIIGILDDARYSDETSAGMHAIDVTI
jgi:hypothetical protein